MTFKIIIKHFDGTGGNLLFTDKEAARDTYGKLEALYEGTTTTLTKAITKEE